MGVAPPAVGVLRRGLRDIPTFFTRPRDIFRGYSASEVTPDIVAGLTVAACQGKTTGRVVSDLLVSWSFPGGKRG